MKSLREVDGDLLNHWYILALEREVPKAKPIRRTLYDVNYVLFRNSRGETGVLLDSCIHRGAKLSEGKVEGDNLRCPYHGWTYATDGQVAEIPSEEVPSKFCAKKIPTVVREGCVWIWPGDPQLATTTPAWNFPEVGNSSIEKYFMITDFENEVTHLVQNFMDVPHTVFVHAKWFRRRSLLKVPILIEARDAKVKVTYQQPNDSIGPFGRLLNPKKEKMFHTDEFIFPNITRVDYKFGNHFFIINSQCSPISRYQTRVYTWIAYRIPFGKIISPIFKFYTRRVIEQDVVIMKNQGNNLQDNELKDNSVEFKSTAADELHLAIDQMRKQGVTSRQAPEKLSFTKERELWI